MLAEAGLLDGRRATVHWLYANLLAERYLPPEGRAKLDQALELAGKHLGPGAPQWQRLEAISQEYLAAHPVEPSESEREQVLRWPVHVSGWMESAKEALEEETRRWAFLCPVEPVAAPAAGPGEDGDKDPHCFPHHLPHLLDAELRGRVAMRDGWDELVGHLGLLVSMLGLWRTMGFASFAHYCAERLGMAARTVEQRVWLERRLYALPPLRRALREGRVGYEKARLVAVHADDSTVEAWIELRRRPRTDPLSAVRGIHSRLRVMGRRAVASGGSDRLRRGGGNAPREPARLPRAAFTGERLARGAPAPG